MLVKSAVSDAAVPAQGRSNLDVVETQFGFHVIKRTK